MFYDVYKKLCKDRGLSPTRAGVEMGLSRGNISYWKRLYDQGKEAKPDSYTIDRIASYFGVSTDYLLGRTDDPTNYDTNGELIAEIPVAYIDAADGDIRKAHAMMQAAQADAQKEAALMGDNLRKFSREDANLIFALWGDVDDITDKDLADVRRFAEFLKERKKDRNDN